MRFSFLASRRRPTLLFLVLAAAAVVECVAAATGGPRPSRALIIHPFASIAAATVFFRYLIDDRAGSTRRRIVFLIPLAVVPSLVLQRIGAPPPLPMMVLFVAIGTLGAVGYVWAACRASGSDARLEWLARLCDALVLPVSASMLAFGLWSTYRINPVYDVRLYAFETILGAPISLMIRKAFPFTWPVSAIANGCYAALPIGMVLAAAAQRERARQSAVIQTTVVAGLCGFLLYFVCPGVGTEHAFGGQNPPILSSTLSETPLIGALLGEPRNAMPSLHAVWALLMLFNARPLPPLMRRTCRVFAAMNLAAVMGTVGNHWFMDVVVAVPLAVAVQSAVVTRMDDASRRWAIDAAACAALTLIWVMGFRLGRPLLDAPFALAWAATAFTAVWPLLRCRRQALIPEGFAIASDTLNSVRPGADSTAITASL